MRDGQEVESISVRVGGDDVRTIVCRPSTSPRAAVVLGAEAVGINAFIIDVARRLAEQGYLTVVPDFFHGSGPEDPDAIYDWDHLADIRRYIDGLDFRRGTEDMLAAAAHVRSIERIDKVAVWGYCTGGTLSLLAACLGRDIDAAVLFYPSQPTFDELTVKRPSHPIDLLWNLHAPVLLLLGDQDPAWPTELVRDVKARLEQWSIPHEIEVYEGAEHVFAGHFGDSYRPAVDADSWARALAFLDRYVDC